MVWLHSCTTHDVITDTEDPRTGNFYEISDAAFADYLMYNSTLPPTDDNSLPPGIVFSREGSMLLDADIAATVTLLYLVKDNNRMENLVNAGVPTGNVKIANLDGIQFFTNLETMRLTSNVLTGTLDLSMLNKLSILEMNSNFVNELIVPASVTRLRYAASTSDSSPDDRWLSEIDLSTNSQIDHIHLPNHHISVEGFKLPENYEQLTYINVEGNTDAPFEIPTDLYNRLSTKNGVIPVEPVTPPEVDDHLVMIPDRAFAEYLMHNSTLDAEDSNKLPEGIVIEEEGALLLDKEVAATVEVLYLVKDNTRMGNLEQAGVPTAREKITNLEGIEHFTNVTEIKLTSNQIVEKLDLSMLEKLVTLEMNSNYVNELIVPASLTRLRYAASSSAPENGKLTSINLAANSAINHIHLPNHEIITEGLVLPSSYASLTYIDLSGNTGAPFTIAADLFNQLDTSKGVTAP